MTEAQKRKTGPSRGSGFSRRKERRDKA